MKITDELVTELNNELSNRGCSFIYKYDEYGSSGNPQIKISLPTLTDVDSFIINPSKDFFEWLTIWFKNRGIELSGNADGSIMWSKSGWDN